MEKAKENPSPLHNGVESNGVEVNGTTAKPTRTPETPRPVADRPPTADNSQAPNAEHSKDSKVLKLKEDPPVTDRKLRSADSPKPESKKPQETETQAKKATDKQSESPKKSQEKVQESPKKLQEDEKSAKTSHEKPVTKDDQGKGVEVKDKQDGNKASEKEKVERTLEVDVEIIVESDGNLEEEENRKLDTNYSKSRVKVSPYRRSMRLADQTTSSLLANYTGNNTTMETDLTESSLLEDPPLDDSMGSPYLSGLRTIRGRRSYKQLGHLPLTSRVNRAKLSDIPQRPTGTVVGRKRKPDAEDSIEVAVELTEQVEEFPILSRTKRMRLIDRIAQPFKRTVSTPLPSRAAERVGLNSDLMLTLPMDPVSDTFDAESLKAEPLPPVVSPPPIVPSPPTVSSTNRDSKRCIVM